ncbi:hypothetical protein FRC11_003402 [Ceratobasidium sp. 423]|nr:hypothetical protein FRC11_003402 [Ceratobasidium sp. 423]
MPISRCSAPSNTVGVGAPAEPTEQGNGPIQPIVPVEVNNQVIFPDTANNFGPQGLQGVVNPVPPQIPAPQASPLNRSLYGILLVGGN